MGGLMPLISGNLALPLLLVLAFSGGLSCGRHVLDTAAADHAPINSSIVESGPKEVVQRYCILAENGELDSLKEFVTVTPRDYRQYRLAKEKTLENAGAGMSKGSPVARPDVLTIPPSTKAIDTLVYENTSRSIPNAIYGHRIRFVEIT